MPHPQTLKVSKREKHSCLLQTFINYGRKKFYNIGLWMCKRKTKMVLIYKLIDCLGTFLFFYELHDFTYKQRLIMNSHPNQTTDLYLKYKTVAHTWES
jgi:hypothetical protein